MLAWPTRAAITRPRVAWAGTGVAAAAAAATAARFPAIADSGAVLCLFRALTGVPCPGCGLTRGFAALAAGDLAAALVLHPLAPLLALELAAAWALVGLKAFGAGGAVLRRLDLVALGNAGALLAVWGARLWTGTLPY